MEANKIDPYSRAGRESSPREFDDTPQYIIATTRRYSATLRAISGIDIDLDHSTPMLSLLQDPKY